MLQMHQVVGKMLEKGVEPCDLGKTMVLLMEYASNHQHSATIGINHVVWQTIMHSNGKMMYNLSFHVESMLKLVELAHTWSNLDEED